MPITLLDIILISVMLLSGILAMVRGFLREVFSIISWVAAAAVTLYFYPQALPLAKQYISQEQVAMAATIAALFLGTLLIVSIISARMSDAVLDSRIGPLDRTLGFFFGMARGLLVVVVAFLFFNWLVPDKSQPAWVANAKSRPVLQSTGEWLTSLLPEDPENTILKRLKHLPLGEEGDAPAAPGAPASGQPAPAAPPAGGQPAPAGGNRTDRGGLTTVAAGTPAKPEKSGYRASERQGFDQLLESARGSGQ